MDVVTMFNDCFNLKIGWMVSIYIPMVPLGFDMAYPAELQGLCALLLLPSRLCKPRGGNDASAARAAIN